ncbi:phage tail tape measure protein [bacterium (Candidatus Blackallbacteria) CG17_big_fil_post_rev_8_21_14_2_50_48_46]|uniref:Phage tail tape measure protein n=1 Tax=bacterium (Candidatus Blackallbacteria) CG17_big_fil_post_rev_8_21_14_2_50_48_46 TaxID=2014261 RepID=A0A2M7G5R6_9BACT|nr:MAG: phage tail tape measure protein [bacterium (Candidatus Blackallbacteria) CG18_big_fil_WC_8_21_14_2_50_49_26]PIW17308.1 MAG: phage tail tape measure protein [bacterium (Candidatus Blackallbacteria) CG17_big_fil_post_rev_8_21_14_2_50_48_46]PIW47461.1 MAG: phage tail tape measure protein [bacterium (Candidatus Blackallbacteria) CG13_big_fil_rev_8_21_14_2_50_49_14]
MSDMLLAMLLTLKDMASGPLGQFQGNVKKLSHDLMATGVVSRAMGQGILNGLKAPIAAFAEAEDAATRLRVSMMDSKGISKGFEQVNKLATDLGNKLPGTTADFQEMMTALNQQGVSAQSILGGVGKSAAYLGVQLKMPYRDAAIFAAKVGEAAGVAAKDMEKFMDTIQRTANLGVETTEMQYAFGRSAGALKNVGMQGLESAKSLSVMYAQLIKTGLSGETVGTNFAGMLENLKKYQYQIGDKATTAHQSLKKLGIEMQFFDKQGKMNGPREMIAQLEKLKKLTPEQRAKAMDGIFGGGQDSQMVNTLVAGGVKAYDEMARKAKAQADLNAKVEAQLRTLKNIWDSATGTFTNMLATLGESIAPELKAMADGLGKISEKLQAFAKAHPMLTKIVVGLTAISGVALLVGGTALMGLGAISSGAPLAGAAVTILSTKFYALMSSVLKSSAAMKAWNAVTGAKLVAGGNASVGGTFTRMATGMKNYASSVAMAAKGGIVALPGLIMTKASAMRVATVAGAKWSVQMLTAKHSVSGLASAGWARILTGLRAVAVGFRAMGLAALANPVGIAIAAIAVGAVLVFKYWKPISGFFKGLWHGLMVGLKPLKPAFDAAFAAVAPIIQPIVGALKGVWNWLKSLLSPVDDVGNRGQKMGVQMGLAIAGIIKKGAEMLTYFTGLPGQLLSIGTNMMMGLLNGITAGAGRVLAKIGEIANSIKSKFAGIMGIQSPSRVFMGFGQNLGAGLELGMVAKAAGIAGAAKKLAIAATPNMPKVAAPNLALASARGGAGGGNQITFAPTIQLMAGPGLSSEQQMQQAVRDLYPEFKRLMDRYSHDKKRANA